MPADKRTREIAWPGYAFAVAVAVAMYGIRFEIERLTGVRLLLPLCGLAVVLASIWRGGVGPAIVASLLTTAWYVNESGVSRPEAWVPCLIYVLEAGVVCSWGTQLRTAKDEAEQGADWQRHLVQTAGEGIWMVAPDGIIGYANPRIAEMLGCDVRDIEGCKVDLFLFPEDLPAERIRFQNRRAGFKEQYDRRLRRVDGSEAWTLACSSPYAYRKKDAGVLTMMTDITERKKAEHALRRSERKFRELFENIREGVYQTSPDGRILAANPELLRMLGFSNQEELNVVGVVRDTFVDVDLHQSLRDRLERDGSYANVEFQLRTRDHRIITVSENARVVRDENGNVLYYEGTLTDITDKLRFEKQLRQAQKMEALGRLAGGIARDFRAIGEGMRTGLRHAMGVLPEDSLARPQLEAVVRSMNSAEALTHQILDFSQRQIHRHEGDTQSAAPIDINGLIADLEQELRQLAGPGNPLELSLCEDLTPVIAEPGNIAQIVTRLVILVRDFGPDGKTIQLSTAIVANTPVTNGLAAVGSFVSLSVYAAADGDRVDDGMSTSRAILAQYGGTLTTAQSDGVIRYSLYLPLASGMHQGGDSSLKSVHQPGDAFVTVLLVEEEPLIRELSRDRLERQGFRVLTAGTAAEAERIARGEQTFDVLITDWATDDGKSAALVQLLRGMRPELRVLFISGYGDGAPAGIPRQDGSATLQKPFSGESLARKIRQLLGKPE